MTRLVKFAALTVAVTLFVMAGHLYKDPMIAASSCNTVQSYLSHGYTTVSCTATPVNYFAEPTGNYEWGYVETELIGEPVGGEGTMPRVYIRCHVQGHEKNGVHRFHETHNIVRATK